MKIIVDGIPRETSAQTIGDVLEHPPTEEEPALIMHMTSKEVEIQNTYDIKTTKGTITIETHAGPYHDFFREHLADFSNRALQWADKYSVTFGTFATPFEPTRKQFDYDTYDVIIGLIGHDRSQGILTFQKQGHIWNNGLEKSAFGKIIKGRSVLHKLGRGDRIESIEVKTENAELFERTLVTSADADVHEGDIIVSKLIVELDTSCPYAVEHFLFMTREGFLTIDENLNTFGKSSGMRGVEIPSEHVSARSKGAVSVRTAGKDKGCVYLSYHDIIEDGSHTVFGHVTNGLDLAVQAPEGGRIRVEPSFRRLNTLGLSTAEARAIAEDAGITVEITGDDAQDTIVIAQDPELSTEAIRTGKIHISTADRKNVFTIRLYEEDAPLTAAYFKTISGLKTRALGRLSVFFAHEDLDMVLFTGNDKLAGTLTPENNPEEKVFAGEVGITNMASRQRGTVGIRFSDSPEYGPTGEDFAHTNIVGKVDDTIKLREIKEGDTIYLLLEV